MATVFSKIRKREISGHILEDTGEFFAFLDITPKQKGHTLVVPYPEVDYLFDLDSVTYHKLWDMVAQVSAKLKQTVPCKKIAVVVEGMQVSHVHVHLIPINHEGDLDQRYETTPEDLAQLVKEYRSQ